MRRERERLLDILEAIERIEKYAEGGKETFESDELIQTWIVHHIEIIGEACRSLSNDFQATFSNIPWADIVGMRNILIHHKIIQAKIVTNLHLSAFYKLFTITPYPRNLHNLQSS